MALNTSRLKKAILPGLLLLSAGVIAYTLRPVKIPSYAPLLDNFDIEKYSGKWYEIARFDFKHEKDLSNVTAQYNLNEDGSIQVINRGFNTKTQEWQEAVGKAKPNGKPGQSALKVSFFGPFFSGYNVVKITADYKNALVFGENRDYIWILARTPTINDTTKNRFLKVARDAGYDLDRLVWTQHDQNQKNEKNEEKPPQKD